MTNNNNIYDHKLNDILEIYKGDYFSKPKRSRAKQVVVFDLDETLGSFADLEILWKLINEYRQSHTVSFDELLDIYPEFIRYGIMSILEYLKHKKNSGECYKLYLYTNNRGGKEWARKIISYFNSKISKRNKLFDQIIYAFKINNVQIELARTTNKKTIDDFIRCTLLPRTTTVCFIDDTYFKDMQKERIYYIKPKPYHHHLSSNEIINRFIFSKIGELLLRTQSMKTAFKHNYIERTIKYDVYTKDHIEPTAVLEHDIITSQKIMYHLKDYFLLTNKKSKTCKRKHPSYRFTQKRKT